MNPHVSGVLNPPPNRDSVCDTTDHLDAPSPTLTTVATLDHRTYVHPVTRAGCLQCLPQPCVCGRLLCPEAFEHRRAVASSESYWRSTK